MSNPNVPANRQYAANLVQQQRAAMQQAANGSSPHMPNQQLMAGQSPSASGTASAGTPNSNQGGTTAAPEPALVTKVSQAIALLRSANPAAGDAFLNRVKTIPQSQILQALTEALAQNGLGYAAAALMPGRAASAQNAGQAQVRPPAQPQQAAAALAAAAVAGGNAAGSGGQQPGSVPLQQQGSQPGSAQRTASTQAIYASLQAFGLGTANFNSDAAFQSLKNRPIDEAVGGIQAIGANISSQIKALQARLGVNEAQGGPNEQERRKLVVELQQRTQIIQRCKEEFARLTKLRQVAQGAKGVAAGRPPQMSGTASPSRGGTASPAIPPGTQTGGPRAGGSAGPSTPTTGTNPAALPPTPGSSSAMHKGMNLNSAQPNIPVPANLDHLRNSAAVTQPQPFPTARGSRPTLSQGLANSNPVVGTPGILRRPEIGTPGGIASVGTSAAGAAAPAQSWEGLLNVSSEKNVASTAAILGEDGLLGEDGGLGGVGGANGSAGNTTGTSGMLRPTGRLLEKRKIQELVGDIDPTEVLEGEVEDLFLELADEFIESVTQMACRLAKHRKGDRLEVKDVQLHLERNWNLRVPFPGSNPIAPPRIRGGAGGAGAPNAGAKNA